MSFINRFGTVKYKTLLVFSGKVLIVAEHGLLEIQKLKVLHYTLSHNFSHQTSPLKFN
jgi:hypothetical protein